jgi:DNA-binding MarR family transcriptional regulator
MFDVQPTSDKVSMPPYQTAAKQSLAIEEKASMLTMFSATDPFTAVYSIMPIQQARTFLLVAMEEGLGVGEYARRAGANPTVMTRHMLDLGEMNRRHEPGLALVYTRPNPMNRRMHQVFLTPKGIALAHAVHRALIKAKK